MFENIKGFWERMRGNMLEKTTIGRAFNQKVAVSQEMHHAIELWKEMYERQEGLHLASVIAFEMARLITVELNSEVLGGERAEFLNKQYKRVLENIRIPVEFGCAKGGLVLKPYVVQNEILVDFIQADKFFPTDFDEMGRIRGAVFVQSLVRGNKFYTRLESHRFEGQTYVISNKAFCSNSRDFVGGEVSLSEVEEWKDLAEQLSIANVKKPLFGYFRPHIANTVDASSPLGVSVFANAVNLIEDADVQYERLLWEFESGERALIANSMAFKRDRDGKPRLPDKRLYKTLDVEDIDFFKEWSPQIRVEEFAAGLNKIFRQIEFNCGLAFGTISEVSESEKTAEEIRSSKQRSYATVADNQKALQNALSDLVYGMDVWCTLYKLAPKGDYGLRFDFDDSIAADRKAQFEEKVSLVNMGIMTPEEFRMWYFGEDEETAKRMLSGEK